MEQLLHAPAVQFKGTGWYVTDYAGKKPEGAASNSSDGSADKSEKKETASTHKEKDKDSKPKKSEAKKTKE